MAKNTSRLRVAPLQRVVAEPITDPAEQAALDVQRRRARDNGLLLPTEDGTATPPPAAASRLLELSRRLPAEQRVALLARVSAALPVEQQFMILAQALAPLVSECLHALEGELIAQLEAYELPNITPFGFPARPGKNQGFSAR
jgi:hypothetical protein